jgi:DNA-binding response OmpR family regulator
VRASILILEDEATLRRQLVRLFATRGYDVVDTGSIAGFLDATAVRSYDACLLDLWLPDGNGLDAWECARASQPRAVAVVMTAEPTPIAEERARRLGCSRLLAKPLDLPVLLAACAATG